MNNCDRDNDNYAIIKNETYDMYFSWRSRWSSWASSRGAPRTPTADDRESSSGDQCNMLAEVCCK